MPKQLTIFGFAFRRFAVPGRVGARVFGLNIGCRYSTPVCKRPLHPARSQFKPEASQTQAPVTPRDRAGATRRWKLNNSLVAQRYQVVRHRTRLKNEVHAILHAHLIPKCPHADLFNRPGRAWLSRQPLPGSHITDLQKPWRRIRARAGLEHVRIHDLRHTCAA